jgi:hypothetical protein
MIIIIATFGQALSGQGHAVTIIGVLVVWRFIVCPLPDIDHAVIELFLIRWVSVSVETTL